MPQQPHDVDIKALLRIAVLYNIPTACNRSTADFMISSHLMEQPYQPRIKDYSTYMSRTFADLLHLHRHATYGERGEKPCGWHR